MSESALPSLEDILAESDDDLDERFLQAATIQRKTEAELKAAATHVAPSSAPSDEEQVSLSG